MHPRRLSPFLTVNVTQTLFQVFGKRLRELLIKSLIPFQSPLLLTPSLCLSALLLFFLYTTRGMHILPFLLPEESLFTLLTTNLNLVISGSTMRKGWEKNLIFSSSCFPTQKWWINPIQMSSSPKTYFPSLPLKSIFITLVSLPITLHLQDRLNVSIRVIQNQNFWWGEKDFSSSSLVPLSPS